MPFQLSFEIPFQGTPFQLHLELELNLLDQNVNELEFELCILNVDETNPSLAKIILLRYSAT